MSDVVLGVLGIAVSLVLFRQAWRDSKVTRLEDRQDRTDRRLDKAGIPDVS